MLSEQNGTEELQSVIELHFVCAGQEVMLRDDRGGVTLIIREDGENRSNWRPFPDSFGNANNSVWNMTAQLNEAMKRMDSTIHPKD